MPLDAELAIFRAAEPDLIAQGRAGQWAVVTSSGVRGVYPDYPAALAAGYEACGLGPFAVQEVGAGPKGM